MIIETDCLPILGMISGCATPDLAMLRWIAYVKSLNPDVRHISGKDNAMADMLSRARYEDEDAMVSENEEVGADFFQSARLRTERQNTPPVNGFNEDGYNREWLLIGRFLKTMTIDATTKKEEARWLLKKAYRFFLRNGRIWRVPRRRSDTPLRVIASIEDQQKLISKFHESPWSEHWGTWATFEKLKGKY